MTCSPEDESKRAEEPSLNPAKAVSGEPEDGPDLPLAGKQEELLVEAANIECSDKHSLYRKGSALPVFANHEPTDVADAKQLLKKSLVPQGRAYCYTHRHHLQPSCHLNLCLCWSNRFSPHSSPELKSQLRWKPPDTGAHLTWHTYHAISDRIQLSAGKRSPAPRKASMPSVSRSLLAYFTQAVPPRRQDLPLGWCISIPPAGIQMVRQRTVSTINYNTDVSTEKHSPMSTVHFMQPLHQHTTAGASSPRLLNGELIMSRPTYGMRFSKAALELLVPSSA